MKLKFGHLCEFATRDATAKLSVINIFERILHAPRAELFGPVCALGPFYYAGAIAGSAFEAGPNVVEMRMTDADGEIMKSATISSVMLLGDAGAERTATVVIMFNGVELPSDGDYAFELRVNGEILGTEILVVDTLKMVP